MLTTGDDGDARLWDLASGRKPGPLNGGHRRRHGRVVQPRRQLVVTAGGSDDTARVWEWPPASSFGCFAAIRTSSRPWTSAPTANLAVTGLLGQHGPNLGPGHGPQPGRAQGPSRHGRPRSASARTAATWSTAQLRRHGARLGRRDGRAAARAARAGVPSDPADPDPVTVQDLTDSLILATRAR